MQTSASDRSGQAITVQWRMEAADLVAASKLSSRRGYWAFLLLTVGFLALGIINLVIGVDPTGWAPPFVVGILMALYLLIGARLHVGRQARSLVGEDIVVRVDESGIHRDTTGSHQWSEWSALTGVSESLTSIVLRRDRLPAYFLPKRAFASQADVDAFLAYLRSHLGSRSGSA